MILRTGNGSKVMQGENEIKQVNSVSIEINDGITYANVRIALSSIETKDGDGFLIDLIDDDN